MTELLLDVKLGIPTVECGFHVADQWQEGFKNNAQRINEKRLARVGTEQSFSEVLAAPASAGYKGYLNPSGTTRKGRTGAQAEKSHGINIARGAQKYLERLARAFKVPVCGGQSIFQDSIDQAKGSYVKGMEDRTLRVTGTGSGELGLAGLVGMFLTEDNKVGGRLRGCDSFLFGAPVMFPVSANSWALRALLPGVITYTGVEWIKNNYSDDSALSLNTFLAGVLSGLVDYDSCGVPVVPYDAGKTFIGWVKDSVMGPIFRLRVFSGEGVPVAIPVGVIVLWKGLIADIPAGWFLCDGNNGTPDLRDKFVVGAKQDDAGTTKTNITGLLTKSGGAVTHKHTGPSHQHSGAPHDHTVSGDTGAGDLATPGPATGTNRASSLYHVHAIDLPTSGPSAGDTGFGGSGDTSTVQHLPDYYALAWIMKG